MAFENTITVNNMIVGLSVWAFCTRFLISHLFIRKTISDKEQLFSLSETVADSTINCVKHHSELNLFSFNNNQKLKELQHKNPRKQGENYCLSYTLGLSLKLKPNWFLCNSCTVKMKHLILNEDSSLISQLYIHQSQSSFKFNTGMHKSFMMYKSFMMITMGFKSWMYVQQLGEVSLKDCLDSVPQKHIAAT